MEQYQAAATALLSTAIAVAGWLYSRRIGVQKAYEQAMAANGVTIAALESRIRILEDTRDDCDKQLKIALAAVAKWDDMLGKIWIRDFGGSE